MPGAGTLTPAKKDLLRALVRLEKEKGASFDETIGTMLSQYNENTSLAKEIEAFIRSVWDSL